MLPNEVVRKPRLYDRQRSLLASSRGQPNKLLNVMPEKIPEMGALANMLLGSNHRLSVVSHTEGIAF